MFIGVYLLAPSPAADESGIEDDLALRESSSGEAPSEMQKLNVENQRSLSRARGFSWDSTGSDNVRMVNVWGTISDSEFTSMVDGDPLRKLGVAVGDKIEIQGRRATRAMSKVAKRTTLRAPSNVAVSGSAGAQQMQHHQHQDDADKNGGNRKSPLRKLTGKKEDKYIAKGGMETTDVV